MATHEARRRPAPVVVGIVILVVVVSFTAGVVLTAVALSSIEELDLWSATPVRSGIAITASLLGLVAAAAWAARRLHETGEELRRLNASLEARIEARTADLETSHRDLERFAYVVSHDLQEPLRAIAGYTSLLEQHVADHLGEEGRRYVEVVQAAVDRQRGMLEDLLRLSRVQRHDAVVEAVDLRDLVEVVREDLQPALVDEDARLEVAPDLPTVRSDRALLRTILANLVGNAAKFHGPDAPPTICVDAGVEPSGAAWISVADDGIGIDAAHLQRIWEPFQRLHTRSEYPGSGIGLGIVRTAAERLGGRVEVTSTPGAGTMFTLRLPGARPESR